MPSAFVRGSLIRMVATVRDDGPNVDGRWVIKSTATMPDGDSGSATIYIEPVDNDKFLMKGFDRIVGDASLPDFEATIVRKPPQPAK